MERQNNRSPRARKQDAQKRDAAASPVRYARNERGQTRQRNREDNQLSGLNRFGLNDLYERSTS